MNRRSTEVVSLLVASIAITLVACGGRAEGAPASEDNRGAATQTPAASRTPRQHRATSEPCVSDREDLPPGACSTDAQCGAGKLCVCNGGYDPETVRAVSRCVTGACRVDADCGPGGFCSPEQPWSNSSAYACHTPDDECLHEGDCAAGLECLFARNAKKWICGSPYQGNQP